MKAKIFLLLILSFVVQFGVSQSSKIPTGFKQNTSFLSKKKASALADAKLIPVSLPGRSANFFWNTQSNVWQFNDTSVYTYNNSAALIDETRRDGQLYYRTQNTYDAQGRLTLTLYQNWNVNINAWENNSRNVTVYDVQNNQIESRYDTWNSLTNVWETSGGSKNIITYNASNRITMNIQQYWDMNLNNWKDDSRTINYIYDSNGNATEYESQIKNGANWDEDIRYKDTYDLQNKLVEEIVQVWSVSTFINAERYMNVSWYNWTGDLYTSSISSFTSQIWGTPNTNQWNNNQRLNVTYDNFGGSVTLFENYSNPGWVNDMRQFDNYDAQSNYTGFRSENWQIPNSQWNTQYEEKITISYDVNSNITQKIWQYWDAMNQTLVNNEKRVYTNFQLLTGLSSINKDDIAISIFPNPFTTSCTIQLKGVQQNEGLKFKIYDVLGKEVFQTTLNADELRIERGNLPSSIYFYSVMDKNIAVAKGKLVIE